MCNGNCEEPFATHSPDTLPPYPVADIMAKMIAQTLCSTVEHKDSTWVVLPVQCRSGVICDLSVGVVDRSARRGHPSAPAQRGYGVDIHGDGFLPLQDADQHHHPIRGFGHLNSGVDALERPVDNGHLIASLELADDSLRGAGLLLFLMANLVDDGVVDGQQQIAKPHQSHHAKGGPDRGDVLAGGIYMDKQVTGEKHLPHLLPLAPLALVEEDMGQVYGVALILQVGYCKLLLAGFGAHHIPAPIWSLGAAVICLVDVFHNH